MANVSQDGNSLSARALNIAILSLVLAVFLAIAEGYVRGVLAYSSAEGRTVSAGAVSMLSNWCYSLRNIAESVMSAAVLVFAAAKFLEGRTLLTVGFEKFDADKISVKEPDENNIVWIGHRYGTKLEADTIFATLENRIREATVG